MSLTLPELKQRLADQVDEVGLLELLEIDSSDLVEAFSDRIEERMEELSREFEETNSDNDSL